MSLPSARHLMIPVAIAALFLLCACGASDPVSADDASSDALSRAADSVIQAELKPVASPEVDSSDEPSGADAELAADDAAPEQGDASDGRAADDGDVRSIEVEAS